MRSFKIPSGFNTIVRSNLSSNVRDIDVDRIITSRNAPTVVMKFPLGQNATVQLSEIPVNCIKSSNFPSVTNGNKSISTISASSFHTSSKQNGIISQHSISTQASRSRFTTSARCRNNAENGSGANGSRLNMFMHPIKWTRKHMQRTDYAREIYGKCSSQFDERQNMLHYLDMPENFNSWFLFNVLHLWMYNCRMRAEGVEGKEIMQNVFEHLWLDVELKLAEAGAKRVNGIVQKMVASYYGQLLAYDEGIFKGDAVLAAALWRNFLDSDQDITPQKLEQVVIYVRRQLNRVENESTENILTGKFSFEPIEFPFNDGPGSGTGLASNIPNQQKM